MAILGGRSGGAESFGTGKVAKSWLPQERAGDRRTISGHWREDHLFSPAQKLADVRCHRRVGGRFSRDPHGPVLGDPRG
jgi:hypothetical protein